MGFYNDRGPASDHEREAKKAPKGPTARKREITTDERATAKRNRAAEVLRLAPIGFGSLGFILLLEVLSALSFRRLVGPRDLLGIAIVIGMFGALILLIKRPPRIVMLGWLGVLDALLFLSFLVGMPSGPFQVTTYRIFAAILVSSVAAAIAAMTPTGWRPPPIRWEK